MSILPSGEPLIIDHQGRLEK